MAWNTFPGAIPGAGGLSGETKPSIASPAPAPSPAPSFDFNATLPGNSGGASAPSPGSTSPGGGSTTPAGPQPKSGGEISLDLEQLKLGAAQQAAYQAYLSAKLHQDSEQVAINKAIAAANEAYQNKTIEMQGKQLAETQTARLAQGAQSIAQLGTARANAYNTGVSQFEHSGVATQGRINGLNALRQPLPAGAYATMLGLDASDPRVATIAQAAHVIAAGTASPLGGMGG